MDASYPNFVDWKAGNSVFEDIAGYDGTNFTLTELGMPERVSATRFTSNMFSVLGVQPLVGRDFRTEEQGADQPPVVVITHGFWQSRFGGQPDVLAKTLRLGGVAYTIIGVLPRNFEFGLDRGSELFIPLIASPDEMKRRQSRWLKTVGRLKPNVDIPTADREMKRIATTLAAAHADTNSGTSVQLVKLQDQIAGNTRSVLMVVFGAASAMLCLAFVNLANLMIAQSISRQREIGIRTAIGAGSARLGRQLVAESLVFAAVAAAVSLLVAEGTLQWMIDSSVVAPYSAQIDGRVIGFNFALALLAGLLSGSLVAYRSTRGSLTDVTKSGGWSGRSSQALRSVFTVAEIALAVTLMVGAVVMIESVQRLLNVDPGFSAEKIVSMQLSLPSAQYRQDADVTRFYGELRRRVGDIPGVEAAGVVDELPLTTDRGTTRLVVFGKPQPKPGEEQESVIRSASPRYFETMGIRLVRGRTFGDDDVVSTNPVVLLNETLARKLFGESDPIGERIVRRSDRSVYEIVGVVGDVLLADLDRGIRPTFYTSIMQSPSRSSILVVRTAVDVSTMAAAVRAEVNRMDRQLPVYSVRSIEETINRTSGVATRKLVLNLVGVFSSVGAAMAGIGLYGLMSFLVAQRSKEIGLRIALGADRRTVRRLVLNQAMVMTAIGLAVGIVMALAATRFIQGVLFGVTPSDPGILASVAVIVGAIAYVACYVPARRAVRIDRIVVLRQE